MKFSLFLVVLCWVHYARSFPYEHHEVRRSALMSTASPSPGQCLCPCAPGQNQPARHHSVKPQQKAPVTRPKPLSNVQPTPVSQKPHQVPTPVSQQQSDVVAGQKLPSEVKPVPHQQSSQQVKQSPHVTGQQKPPHIQKGQSELTGSSDHQKTKVPEGGHAPTGQLPKQPNVHMNPQQKVPVDVKQPTHQQNQAQGTSMQQKPHPVGEKQSGHILGAGKPVQEHSSSGHQAGVAQPHQQVHKSPIVQHAGDVQTVQHHKPGHGQQPVAKPHQ